MGSRLGPVKPDGASRSTGTKMIQLGHLPAGNHTIRVLAGDGTWLEKSMLVE